MSTTFINQFRAHFTPEIIRGIAQLFGEQPQKTEKAIEQVVPALLGGLVHLSETADGRSRLVSLLNEGHYPASLLTEIPHTVKDEVAARGLIRHGRSLLRHLFGGQQRADRVVNEVAKVSGIRNFSSQSLTSLLAPWALALLQRETSTLTPAALGNYLSAQKEDLATLVPATFLGLLGLNQRPQAVSPTAVEVKQPVEQEKRGLWARFGLPLLFIGFILGAIALFSPFGRSSKAPEAAQSTHITTTSDVAEKPNTETVALPDGNQLDLVQGTINYALSHFLEDRLAVPPKTFVFDNLNFVFGNTQLTPESEKTIQDLVAILNAYPTTEVALEGHTDNVGATARNKALSLERAEAVKTRLIAEGVSATRIVRIEGFGPEKPVTDNSTEEGRAKNRRLELVVVKK
ncbi:MAG: OmpA family protein [Rhodothermia bacterium]|nr:OmpA family protein [Rhodothermia bacterium]